MKTLLMTTLLGVSMAARAQTFSIAGGPIGAGSTTSTGGGLAVTGTVGESLASVMSGGDFKVTTGFWSLVATIATPGAPLLLIQQQPDGWIIVSWPSGPTGLVLEQSHDLVPDGWVASALPVSDDGERKSVHLPVPAGVQFFRLRK